MKEVTTRDLLHRTKEVRAALKSGESMVWTSHGKEVAHLHPPEARSAVKKNDWVARAKEAGAVNRAEATVSSHIYSERD